MQNFTLEEQTTANNADDLNNLDMLILFALSKRKSNEWIFCSKLLGFINAEFGKVDASTSEVSSRVKKNKPLYIYKYVEILTINKQKKIKITDSGLEKIKERKLEENPSFLQESLQTIVGDMDIKILLAISYIIDKKILVTVERVASLMIQALKMTRSFQHVKNIINDKTGEQSNLVREKHIEIYREKSNSNRKILSITRDGKNKISADENFKDEFYRLCDACVIEDEQEEVSDSLTKIILSIVACSGSVDKAANFKEVVEHIIKNYDKEANNKAVSYRIYRCCEKGEYVTKDANNNNAILNLTPKGIDFFEKIKKESGIKVKDKKRKKNDNPCKTKEKLARTISEVEVDVVPPVIEQVADMMTVQHSSSLVKSEKNIISSVPPEMGLQSFDFESDANVEEFPSPFVDENMIEFNCNSINDFLDDSNAFGSKQLDNPDLSYFDKADFEEMFLDDSRSFWGRGFFIEAPLAYSNFDNQESYLGFVAHDVEVDNSLSNMCFSDDLPELFLESELEKDIAQKHEVKIEPSCVVDKEKIASKSNADSSVIKKTINLTVHEWDIKILFAVSGLGSTVHVRSIVNFINEFFEFKEFNYVKRVVYRQVENSLFLHKCLNIGNVDGKMAITISDNGKKFLENFISCLERKFGLVKTEEEEFDNEIARKTLVLTRAFLAKKLPSKNNDCFLLSALDEKILLAVSAHSTDKNGKAKDVSIKNIASFLKKNLKGKHTLENLKNSVRKRTTGESNLCVGGFLVVEKEGREKHLKIKDLGIKYLENKAVKKVDMEKSKLVKNDSNLAAKNYNDVHNLLKNGKQSEDKELGVTGSEGEEKYQNHFTIAKGRWGKSVFANSDSDPKPGLDCENGSSMKN